VLLDHKEPRETKAILAQLALKARKELRELKVQKGRKEK
jgi:hypothetical protein